MYTTKLAQKADIKRIIEIARETWPTTYGHILSHEQIDYMLERLYNFDTLATQIDNGISYVLIVEDTKTFGFIAFEPNESPNEESYIKIHKLYVHPDYHGKGAGKLLIQISEEFSRNTGIPSLKLNVNKYNKSKDFYLANGFKIKEAVVLNIGNGYVMDDYIMEKHVH